MTRSADMYRPVRFTGGVYASTLVAVMAALALTACVYQPLQYGEYQKWMGTHIYLEVLQGYTYIVGLLILFAIYAFLHRHRDKYKLLSAEDVDESDDNDVGDEMEARLEQPRYVTASTSQQLPQRSTIKNNNQAIVSHNANEVNFYVRIAILIFGTGFMTQGGFKLAYLYKEGSISLECINVSHVIVTGLCILFTFFQAFFLFKNHKLVIQTNRNVFKRGLAHLIATNVCTLIITILYEVHTVAYPIVRRYNHTLETTNTTEKLKVGWWGGGLSGNSTCNKIVYLSNKASSYLYPCSVQYCVIAVFVLVKLYHQIGSKWPRLECARVEWVDPKKEIEFVIDDNEDDDDKKDDEVVVVDEGVAYNTIRSSKHEDKKITIVDCDKAHKGLFAGLLVVVFTFIMLCCFFVFAKTNIKISNTHTDLEASYFFYSLEYFLLIVSLLATLFAACKFTKLGVLKMKGKKFFNTEKTLLVISYPSVVILQTFYLVATVFGILQSHFKNPKSGAEFFGDQNILGILTLCSAVAVILNVFVQISFIVSAFKRVTSTYKQKREKPGRALVTFLIFCNLALFIVAIFEHERIHYNLMQSSLFSGTFWNVIIRLILPFHILFRFTSMASLTTIWKTTYTVSSYL